MEDAFDISDDDEDDYSGRPEERRPMIPASASSPAPAQSSNGQDHSQNNLYNFEYDYTMPPPGSPPRPSALAIPDNIFGNTNGYIPVETQVPDPPASRRNWFQRTLAPILPSSFSQSGQRRPIGGGSNNDGVFANVVAKPTVPRTTELNQAEQGSSNVHVAPEFEQKDAPPTYHEAQQDAVPPYWDTTVLAPANMGDELIIEGMAPGHVFSFITSFFISFSFQFIGMSVRLCHPRHTLLTCLVSGFMLTSILAATHAAKFGSRAGLGITLVQYGFYLRSNLREAQLEIAEANVNGWPAGTEPHPTFTSAEEADAYYSSKGAVAPTGLPEIPSLGSSDYGIPQEVTVATDWLSFFLMTVGWLVFLTSLLGFWRVKRWERSIRQSQTPGAVGGASDLERPMIRALRENPFRDMSRMFARLPSQQQQQQSGTTSGAPPTRSEPEREHTPPPSSPPMDPESRQRYDAAIAVNHR